MSDIFKAIIRGFGTAPEQTRSHTDRIDHSLILENCLQSINVECDFSHVQMFPDVQDLAILAADAYDFKKDYAALPYTVEVNSHPSNQTRAWECFAIRHRKGEDGYRGTAYINLATTQVVIAHKGTTFNLLTNPRSTWKDLRADWKLLLGKDVQHLESALDFTSTIVTLCRDRALSITNTGHSLGGWLAQLVGFYIEYPNYLESSPQNPQSYHLRTVAFESPGARAGLTNITCFYKPDVNWQWVRDVELLDNNVLLMDPNLINQLREHVGSVYKILSLKNPKLSSSHGILNIIQCLSESRHDRQIREVRRFSRIRGEVEFDEVNVKSVNLCSKLQCKMSIFNSLEREFLTSMFQYISLRRGLPEQVGFESEAAIVSDEVVLKVLKEFGHDDKLLSFRGQRSFTIEKCFLSLIGHVGEPESQVFGADHFVSFTKIFTKLHADRCDKVIKMSTPSLKQAYSHRATKNYVETLPLLKNCTTQNLKMKLQNFLIGQQAYILNLIIPPAQESKFMTHILRSLLDIRNEAAYIPSDGYTCLLRPFAQACRQFVCTTSTQFFELCNEIDSAHLGLVFPNSSVNLCVLLWNSGSSSGHDDGDISHLTFILKILRERNQNNSGSGSGTLKKLIVVSSELKLLKEVDLGECSAFVLNCGANDDYFGLNIDNWSVDLEKVRVSIQGNTLPLNSLPIFTNSINDFGKLFPKDTDVSDVVCEITATKTMELVRAKLPVLPVRYIPRNIYHHLLHCRKRKDDLFQEFLRTIAVSLPNGHTQDLDLQTIVCESLGKARADQIKFVKNRAEFLCSSATTTAHWFVYEDGFLVWQESKNGSFPEPYFIDNPNRFSPCFDELGLLTSPQKCTIVADDPGMGKSASIIKLFLEQVDMLAGATTTNVPITWPIYIDLNKFVCTSELENLRLLEDKSNQTWAEFIGNVIKASEFGKRLLKITLDGELEDSLKIRLFVDSFDETSSELQPVAITFLQAMQCCHNVSFIVATRIWAKQGLEENLKLKSHRLVKISPEDRTTYLVERLKDFLSESDLSCRWATEIENFDTHAENFANGALTELSEIVGDESFLGIPLQLVMLSKIQRATFIEFVSGGCQGQVKPFRYNSIMELYEAYISAKLQIWEEEKLKYRGLLGIPFFKNLALPTLENVHYFSAISAKFSQDVHEFFTTANTPKDDHFDAMHVVGVCSAAAASASPDSAATTKPNTSKFYFEHETLLQFFVAKFLLANIDVQRGKVEAFLQKNYFMESFTKIRYFFDSLAFSQCQNSTNHSSPHRTLLSLDAFCKMKSPFHRTGNCFEDKFQQILFDFTKIDKLGRNILHYASMYCNHSSSGIFWMIAQNPRLVHLTDLVYGFTPLAYLILSSHCDFLITSKFKECKAINPFYAMYFGTDNHKQIGRSLQRNFEFSIDQTINKLLTHGHAIGGPNHKAKCGVLNQPVAEISFDTVSLPNDLLRTRAEVLNELIRESNRVLELRNVKQKQGRNFF